MSERAVLAAVVAAVLAAIAAVRIPWWLAAAVAVVALATRRAPLVVVAVALGVSCLAERAEAGLVTPVGAQVSGWATLTADPEAAPGGWSIEVSVGGRRYRAFLDATRGRVVRPLLTGERVELRGTVVELRGARAWIESRHLSGRLRVSSVGRTDGGAPWWRLASVVRRTVDDGLSSFEPDERALFAGVVFGDDRGQSLSTRQRFRSSGLAHLLAVSGQNVAFVLVALSPLLERLGLRRRWIVTLVALVGFALVTRFEPSVLRATAMAAVAATATMRGRYTSGVRVVGVAVLVLLVVDPLLVWSAGFRLSVAASTALVVLARPIERRLAGPRWLTEPLAVSLAAQVGTAPLLVASFGTVPLLAPVTNLVAVPVAGWLMVWGVVTGPVAGIVGEPLAGWLGVPSRLLVGWIDGVARVASAPALPTLGVVGAMAMTVVVLVSLAPRAVWARGLQAAGCLAVVADLTLLLPSGHLGPSGGVDLWVGRGRGPVAVVLGSTARDADVLDALSRARVGHVDVVVVAAASRRLAAVVASVRDAYGAVRVLAADPTQIRDAEALTAGVVGVGELRLSVTLLDTRASSSGTGGPRFAVGGAV